MSECINSWRYCHVVNGKIKSGPSMTRNRVRKSEINWLWEDAGRGEVPKGMQLNHHCDNPRCINLDHVYLGTQYQNVHDAFARGRRDMKAVQAGQWWRGTRD